jgi:CRP/FNR family transcriptional regulator, cyclic AMP receptor protein
VTVSALSVSAPARPFTDDEQAAPHRVSRHLRTFRSPPDPLSAVSDNGFLANLTTGLAAELIRSASLVHHRRGSALVPTHDAPWAAVVVSGMLRQYLPARGGRQVTIRYVRAGDLVGSMDTGGSRLGPEVVAVEPSDVLHLDVARIERAAWHTPEFSLALTSELTNRLVHVYRVLASTAFGTVRSRVARDLLERAGSAQATRPGARVWVTQQALADATGSVREVVARALRELRLLGVIETYGSRVTILRVDRLIDEAGTGM